MAFIMSVKGLPGDALWR